MTRRKPPPEPSPPVRRVLPDTRRSITHKVCIDGLNVYFTVGFYDDETIAEVFVNAGKIGSTVRGLLNDLARLLSFSLQYGTPARDLFTRMSGNSYPPQGDTRNPDIAKCRSITDYLFTWLLSLMEEENDG